MEISLYYCEVCSFTSKKKKALDKHKIKHSGKFSEEQNDEWNTKLPKFTRQTNEMITGEILDKKILHDNIKFMVNLSNDFVFQDENLVYKNECKTNFGDNMLFNEQLGQNETNEFIGNPEVNQSNFQDSKDLIQNENKIFTKNSSKRKKGRSKVEKRSEIGEKLKKFIASRKHLITSGESYFFPAENVSSAGNWDEDDLKTFYRFPDSKSSQVIPGDFFIVNKEDKINDEDFSKMGHYTSHCSLPDCSPKEGVISQPSCYQYISQHTKTHLLEQEEVKTEHVDSMDVYLNFSYCLDDVVNDVLEVEDDTKTKIKRRSDKHIKKLLEAYNWEDDSTLPAGWKRRSIQNGKSVAYRYLSPSGYQFESKAKIIYYLMEIKADPKDIELVEKTCKRRKTIKAEVKSEIKKEHIEEETSFMDLSFASTFSNESSFTTNDLELSFDSTNLSENTSSTLTKDIVKDRSIASDGNNPSEDTSSPLSEGKVDDELFASNGNNPTESIKENSHDKPKDVTPDISTQSFSTSGYFTEFTNLFSSNTISCDMSNNTSVPSVEDANAVRVAQKDQRCDVITNVGNILEDISSKNSLKRKPTLPKKWKPQTLENDNLSPKIEQSSKKPSLDMETLKCDKPTSLDQDNFKCDTCFQEFATSFKLSKHSQYNLCKLPNSSILKPQIPTDLKQPIGIDFQNIPSITKPSTTFIGKQIQRQKSAIIWEYFKKMEGNTNAHCIHCDVSVSRPLGTTSKMIGHLKSNHKDLYQTYEIHQKEVKEQSKLNSSSNDNEKGIKTNKKETINSQTVLKKDHIDITQPNKVVLNQINMEPSLPVELKPESPLLKLRKLDVPIKTKQKQKITVPASQNKKTGSFNIETGEWECASKIPMFGQTAQVKVNVLKPPTISRTVEIKKVVDNKRKSEDLKQIPVLLPKVARLSVPANENSKKSAPQRSIPQGKIPQGRIPSLKRNQPKIKINSNKQVVRISRVLPPGVCLPYKNSCTSTGS